MRKVEKKFLFASWALVLVVLAVTFGFVLVLKNNARMETNLDEYMPRTHPAFVYSDQAEEWFDIKDGILIAIENKGGIYNPQTLEKIRDISEGLMFMEAIEENDVMSLFTAENIIGTEYGLEVNAFYGRVPDDRESFDRIREAVRTNDMVYGRLVSEDETVALVVAGMQGDVFTQELYREILAFAESFEDEGETIYVAGRPIVEGTMALLGPADMKRMVPLVLAVIAVVLYLLLRSGRATVSILAAVFISTIWAFGLMALTGVPIYSVSTMIPVMLIAIGVAYGVYFFNYLNQYYRAHHNARKITGIRHVLRTLWKPLMMAAFTTIVGFISLLTSQVYPIKYFGTFTAFGILVAFVLALAFLPAMVMITGYRVRGRRPDAKPNGRMWTQAIAESFLKNKRTILIVTGIVVVISLAGISRMWINSSFLDNFEKDSDIVLTDAFVNSRFGGTSTLNVILESEQSDAFKQPEALHLIDRMQSEAETLDRVGNSFSLADYLKRMNKVMNEDQDAFYTIPDHPDLVAQYLLLYEMSGDPQNLVRVINYDYNRTNLTFQLKGDDSKTIKEALAVIRGFEEPLKDLGISMNFAGSGYKALVFSDLILEGQIRSIVLSLGLVLLILMVMFRSVKAGLIGSLPIIVTALISFGVMGLLNIPLSTTTTLLSSIAIGIGIDYAIHFLQHYRMNLAAGASPTVSLYRTMSRTGKAILFNAIVVIAGFMVLLFSVFPPNRTLGALVSMNMFTSFAGTLTLMMVLVYSYKLFVYVPNIKKENKL
ncbi:MAG: MMPL family transporter [Bacteroidales bacterium]